MKALVAFFLILGSAAAQDSAPQKETRRLFGLLATRAVAHFRAADSIEASLNEDGATLHPRHMALRMRIEGTLDEAQDAIDKGEFDRAKEIIQRGEALLDRFAKGF